MYGEKIKDWIKKSEYKNVESFANEVFDINSASFYRKCNKDSFSIIELEKIMNVLGKSWNELLEENVSSSDIFIANNNKNISDTNTDYGQGFLELKERILAVKEHFKLNTNQLAKKAKITRTAMANLESGSSSDCKVSVLRNIISELPVNANWFVTGEGQMIKIEDSNCEKRAKNLQIQVESLQEELQGMKLIVSALQKRLENGESSKLLPAKIEATDVAGSFGLFMEHSARDFRGMPRQAVAMPIA